MARFLNVRWLTSEFSDGNNFGMRVRMEVTDAADVSRAVFAYLMIPRNPETGEEAGEFDHVCSPADLEEFPENEPNQNARPRWFRLTYVDVLVRSRTEADDFIQLVLEDLRGLKATLDVMDTLVEEGTELIGDAPVSSSSSSSSA